ncbi:MAG TPA: prepilin-type N-terminal cleavage/methylation domain-containing protein [Caulifigura sp.]|nr:prepilin-type N-terminal cleavage/methylation domain-containing protein [Caulifigura sp.]
MTSSTARRARRGFTLIELVVVVLVMGILAAVAAPKMFDTASNAKVNTTRQSLMVVRDAIELYKAQNGTYPGQTGSGTALATDLKPFLKGPFPKAQVPGATGDSSVRYVTSGSGVGTVSGVQDWAYNTVDGSFAINVTSYDTY